jgi:hypothetical protein
VRVSHGSETDQANITLQADSDPEYAGQCSYLSPDAVSSNNIAITPESNGNVVVDFAFYSGGTQRMRYSVLEGSQVLAQGRFVVDVTAAEQVWEGTDEFWNYCINESQTTYSEGGRLYCDNPASYSVTMGWPSY